MEPDLGKLWQEQAVEALALSAAEIQAKAHKLHSTVAARNLREWVAAAIVVVCFAATAAATTGLVRVGSLIIVAAAVFMSVVLYLRGRTAPEDGLPGVVFYRRELERQRDLLRGVWWWYLGPLALGMIVFAVGGAVRNPGTSGVVVAAALIAGTFALFGYIGNLNMRAAAELQRQIDVLSALERPPMGEP